MYPGSRDSEVTCYFLLTRLDCSECSRLSAISTVPLNVTEFPVLRNPFRDIYGVNRIWKYVCHFNSSVRRRHFKIGAVVAVAGSMQAYQTWQLFAVSIRRKEG